MLDCSGYHPDQLLPQISVKDYIKTKSPPGGGLRVGGRNSEPPERAPTSAVFNSSFELLWLIWNEPDGFRLPIKACRPPPEPDVPCLQFTVKGRGLESRA
jgi:hypothetical protein